MTFTYLHSSGRFSRTPASVKVDLAAWQADETITLETLTEFKGNPRRKALVEDGWAMFNGVEKPGADDCVIRWRTDRWELLASDTAVVSRVRTWSTSGHEIPPQYVASVLLKDRATGHTLLVSISHLPSHVEVVGGLRANFNRSVRWRDAVRGWKRHLWVLRKQWKPTARLVVADWNMNLRTPWFRRYLAKTFPAMDPTWHRPLPRRGTLNRRIIDVPLVSRRLVVRGRPQFLQHRSSDHTAFRTVLDWTPR